MEEEGNVGEPSREETLHFSFDGGGCDGEHPPVGRATWPRVVMIPFHVSSATELFK